MTPDDVANWKKGKKLKKFDSRACFQGAKGHKEKWEEAFGSGVDYKGRKGETRPWIDRMWE